MLREISRAATYFEHALSRADELHEHLLPVLAAVEIIVFAVAVVRFVKRGHLFFCVFDICR